MPNLSKQKNDSQSQSQRQHNRRSVLWPALLTVNGHEFPCQIWNLSLGGARIRVDLPFKEGTDVTLSLPKKNNSSVKARIAWQDEESCGLLFMVPDSEIKRIFKDSLQTLGLSE
ncbi:PilZ domain-containing protein [Temperatibacter marinus]|uniref:PilZ domain-containing protein n=1 Tax=Temperatibacter marinus TaxID=1456591 RepID=A0AA52EIE4_9PROT|nr:PilZ domain-containing protein [Temperatibacter marinus]WND03738.1 PilZ domain-containing protein [Temperatibacter marinus]